MGINNNGQVVGFSQSSTGTTHAFLYSGGALTDLGTLPGGTSSFATGINNNGQVVGYSLTTGSVYHAFIYSNGTMTDLNSEVSIPGVYLNFANSINDFGQIAAAGSNGHGYLLATATGNTPFGHIDTPANNTTGIAGEVSVTGWALSGAGVQTVGVWRTPVTGEIPSPNGLVFLVNATIVPGSRPDVAAAHPGYPCANCGWGAQVLTNELPDSNGDGGLGNGTYNLHVLVTSYANQVVDLGTVTIGVDNKDSVLPFGTIDTPTQGGTASGTAYVNFGWALTPQPNIIPINGSTIFVFIDNLPVGHPVYNNYRSDIATLFPGYQNSQGAVGFYYIDTTKLTNGLHQISWSVTDNANNTQGVGSRFFNVQN
jgi:probable HAF family extracellular repeat protein